MYIYDRKLSGAQSLPPRPGLGQPSAAVQKCEDFVKPLSRAQRYAPGALDISTVDQWREAAWSEAKRRLGQ